ncbi:MAG: hypothetical protein HZB82_09460 [Deltaproteobacteria bacterium]|nr:hypothetical protein [Deltaproteobacteria bacterium]
MAQITGIPPWFKEARDKPCSTRDARGKGDGTEPFLAKTLSNIASAAARLLDSEECAGRPGLLQGLNPASRIAGICSVIMGAAITKNPAMLGGIILLTAVLAFASRVPPAVLVKRVMPAFAFTAVIIAPVFFMANAGFKAGVFIIARVTAMTALTALLALTTRQTDLFRGLRRLPVPQFFVTALFMTFRYIFILLKMAEDAAFAKKSRLISRAGLRQSQSQNQRWFASRVALFLKKSLDMAEDVMGAMASRGFTGQVKTFDGEGLRQRDYIWLFAAFFVFFLSVGF